MRRHVAAVALVLVAALARADVAMAPQLTVQSFTLANGLDVVLAPDPSVSSVVVLVQLGGGTADETDAQLGYTALLERLFASGTVHTRPGEHDQRIDDAGGFTTSALTPDHLTLTTQVPGGALELALWLEAERMAGLAGGITAAGLATARDAIDAAYRAAYVDEPYGLVERAVREALWPGGHGNRRDVLAPASVLARVTPDAMRAFARRRVAPANATLVIAGAFDRATAVGLVRRYFGWIPGGKRLLATGRVEVAPLPRSVQVELEDRDRRVVVAYRLPAGGAAGLADYEIAAQIVERTLARRLALMRLASGVRVEVIARRHGGELQIHATPLHDAAPARIANAIRTAAGELATSPPSPSTLNQVRASLITERVLALEALPVRAHVLAAAQVDDRTELARRSMRRLAAVTPERVAAAGTWLQNGHAVTAIARPR